MAQRTVSAGKPQDRKAPNEFKGIKPRSEEARTAVSVLENHDTKSRAKDILQKRCLYIRYCNEVFEAHEGYYTYDENSLPGARSTKTTDEEVLNAIQNADTTDARVRYLLAVIEKMSGGTVRSAATEALGDNTAEREKVKDLKFWQIA